jgi:two-component system, chemotaxis family, CheB/CheR fusion protein
MEKDLTSQENPIKKTAHTGVTQHGHTVVAIGASAGGLEAIHEFFDNVPQNTNVSFVVVQHLSPDYKSLLVELVSKHTHMNVFEAEHNMPVHKNCVYVIPNNKLMTIKGGKLQLADKASEKAPNTAIDIFLYSLAEDKGENAIAVILSGTGTDGTRGIESIKAAGGMVLVQDPCTAKFDGMPNSAIASGNADMILAPELMAEEIYTHLQETPVHILNKGKIDENLLEEVFRQVYQHSGHDFHFYKTPTIIRRISRRMTHKGIKKLEEYVTYLQQHPDEAKGLCKDFLIGVTKFFRDPAAFEILYNEVFPEIVSRKNQGGDTFKVWVAACSTGEEAYSMAMLIDKFLLAQKISLEVKIFATDIDEAALEVAARGTYPESIEKDIDPDILERYFVKDGNQYHVGSHIRKQIVFAKHNVIKDPPFIKNDLVSCRNMLIYMSSVLQKKVLATLHFSLNHGGVLLLGPSETVANMQDSLEEVNAKWKIYRKDGNMRMPHTDALYNRSLDYSRYTREPRTERGRFNKTGRDITADFRDVLSEELGYAAFYIDHNYEIKEATGNYKKYISLPEGRLHLNLLKMLPPELSVALNSAIRRAQTENKRVNVKSVRIKGKTRNRNISIIVKPGNKDVPDSLMLVVFGENKNERNAKPSGDMPTDPGPELNKYIIDLEAELKETRTELQMAIEGLETANEELQSSNEELLSANEELQSSNEELQSLNEELHTLNTEHQLKIRELMELNDDLNNYFRSADVAQIFLDAKMIIRKFNPAAVKLVNLIETDIGRPISHISTNLRYHDLVDDIQRVLETSQVFEKEMRLTNGKSSLMRILPYVRQDMHTDGVVITFVDISDLRERDNIIKGVFDSSPSAIMAFSAVRNEHNQIVDFKWLATNYAANKLLGHTAGGFIGKYLKKEFPAVFENGFFEQYVNVVKNETPLSFEYNYQANGANLWFEIVAIKMMDGLVVTLTDVSEKKEAEEKLKKNYSELMNVKENLRKLNLELENKVKERTVKLAESEERFRLVTKATNESIWDWDLGNNKMWWSEGFYSMFDYPRENNHVYSSAFKLERIHPEDRKKVSDSIYQHINNNSNTWSAEYRFAKSDGTYAHILDRGYILHDEFNTPYRMLGSMLDITDLRNAEAEAASNIEQRKFLAESMPLIVWTATPDGELNFLNREFERYSGLSIREGLQSGWEKLVHPEDKRALDREWNHAIQQRKAFSIELRLRKYDGTFCWHILKANPKTDAESTVLLWVGTFTDIHEQKLANEVLESRVKERTKELQQINEELESSNMELQQFASVASHDLKEPLRKIHMFSNLIKEKYFGKAEDGALNYIDRIINSSARMTTLVNDLLSFSRLSVNHLFRSTSLNQLMNDILADLELVIQEKQAVVQVGELPDIEAVPGQMRQVFQNILSNALKFSKKNERPVIKITSEIVADKSIDSPGSPDGKYCRISIADNGIGFDEQYRDKIFTIFQRLHTKEKYEGTGIGLAITKKIIDKHNGLITANSTENKGSNFIIVLPVAQKAGETTDKK